MFPVQIPVINPDDFSRCEERRQAPDPGKRKSLSPDQKTDAALKESIYHALWKDDVLRAIENDAIDVHVHKGIVHLYGHIVSSTSQIRIMNAIQTVSDILVINNNLVLDENLTLEVATSLGTLEHTYDCKFFTGASHGVVSLNGVVSNEEVKMLAEKCAASNPNVRGVINNVRVLGSELGLPVEPFLQPTIGEIIYFLDEISGVVKHVIINPNNRRAMAMIVQGKFIDQRYELNSLTDDKAGLPEQIIVVPMNVVRYMTKVSGFLHINSNERSQYLDFDPASFSSPGWDWVPPYPYCPDNVLFPAEQQDMENQIVQRLPRFPFTVASKEQLLWEQLPANDSLGG